MEISENQCDTNTHNMLTYLLIFQQMALHNSDSSNIIPGTEDSKKEEQQVTPSRVHSHTGKTRPDWGGGSCATE